jgi:hypothetical protein
MSHSGKDSRSLTCRLPLPRPPLPFPRHLARRKDIPPSGNRLLIACIVLSVLFTQLSISVVALFIIVVETGFTRIFASSWNQEAANLRVGSGRVGRSLRASWVARPFFVAMGAEKDVELEKELVIPCVGFRQALNSSNHDAVTPATFRGRPELYYNAPPSGLIIYTSTKSTEVPPLKTGNGEKTRSQRAHLL